MESRIPLTCPETQPPVVKWFKVYCAAMFLLYAVSFIAVVALAIFAPLDSVGQQEMMVFRVMMIVGSIMSLVFGALFVAGMVLKARPWVWVYSIVLIALGLTSICTLPFCIFLLIYWLKPEVKAWYGRP